MRIVRLDDDLVISRFGDFAIFKSQKSRNREITNREIPSGCLAREAEVHNYLLFGQLAIDVLGVHKPHALPSAFRDRGSYVEVLEGSDELPACFA